MTLETPSQHELRTMPESVHQSNGRGGGKSWAYLHTRKQWMDEQRKEHSDLMDSDPEYRKMCMENESRLREMQKGNYLI